MVNRSPVGFCVEWPMDQSLFPIVSFHTRLLAALANGCLHYSRLLLVVVVDGQDFFFMSKERSILIAHKRITIMSNDLLNTPRKAIAPHSTMV